jgi:hypothetical protein
VDGPVIVRWRGTRLGSALVLGGLVILGLVLVLQTGVAGPPGGAPASLWATDPRVNDCGLSTPGNQLRMVVPLDRARDVAAYVPGLGGAPELQNDRPALLVVFRGDYVWFRDGRVYHNVVCVWQQDYTHVYPDVDRTDARLPS